MPDDGWDSLARRFVERTHPVNNDEEARYYHRSSVDSSDIALVLMAAVPFLYVIFCIIVAIKD